jgi:hypothetical protein
MLIGGHAAGFGAKREEEEVYWARVSIIGESACCRLCRVRHNRHTFAVTRLLTWYRQGKDVQRMLPLLSTYLGHCGVDETSVYLRMTRELLQEANRCFERYAFTEVHNG